MKLAIIGSRNIDNICLEKFIPNDVDLIITGGAKGVDQLAVDYAKTHNISLLSVKPNYAKYGKAAPIVRNKEIVLMADLILAFWDTKSHGTKMVIDYATVIGKPIVVHKITNLNN